ncbi:hypothetical protein CK501_16275 [Halovibrio salipaludis]|uniref:Uncharacterized protein n=1 Tax=Halovibrio salipaludis TaxID=2032626 RepID=A0A2A2ET78_9GAMM|nr:hypothetical protein [Halovibrio salipaludis]PAU75848.1 hypothetical protein CK501_16275 [Halovibrio salipaludis]
MSFYLEYPVRGMTVLCHKFSMALFLSLFAALASASSPMDPGIKALQERIACTVTERFSTPAVNAEDRAAALQVFEENLGKNGDGRGISELTLIPADLQEALEQHGQWMAEAGFSGTPGLLYKDPSGQWRGQTGVPSQEALGRMLGVSE